MATSHLLEGRDSFLDTNIKMLEAEAGVTSSLLKSHICLDMPWIRSKTTFEHRLDKTYRTSEVQLNRLSNKLKQ